MAVCIYGDCGNEAASGSVVCQPCKDKRRAIMDNSNRCVADGCENQRERGSIGLLCAECEGKKYGYDLDGNKFDPPLRIPRCLQRYFCECRKEIAIPGMCDDCNRMHAARRKATQEWLAAQGHNDSASY